jgi:RHS repeat-associated protein
MSDYYPVRITWLENAVENSVFLEKSGVSDYTLFGMSMPERSWSLPDACNTYTSLYYDNMLDIDCFVDCGTWVPYGTSSFATCHTSQGYLQIGLYGNLTRGAYTEFDTETDSTYVMSMYITGYNTLCTWEVSVRDAQGNTIVAHTVTQTGTLNLEFTAVGSKSRVYVRRLSSTVTFGSFGMRTLSIDGKYHKEDVMYLSYRYKFNGKELDPLGMGGGGSTYDYGFRIYNAQIARFLSVDPLTASYPWYTPYQFAGNKPIIAIDLDGLEDKIVVRSQYTKLDNTLIAYCSWSDIFPSQKHGPKTSGTLTVIILLFRNTNEPTGNVQFMFSDLQDNTVITRKWQATYPRESTKIEKYYRFESSFEGSQYHSGDQNYEDLGSARRIALSYMLGGPIGVAFQINSETKRFRPISNNTFGGGLIDVSFSLPNGTGDRVINTAQIIWDVRNISKSFKNFTTQANSNSLIFKNKNLSNAVDYMKSMLGTANDASQQVIDKEKDKNNED